MSKKTKKESGFLNLLVNIIWLVLGGLLTSVVWLILGLLLCVTIIGIPFGLQCFKLAKVSLAPFGKDVTINFGSHPIMNIVWALLVGWELFIGYLGSGLLLCITIIGIPFGIKILKFSVIGLFPFGSTIR